MQKSTLLICGLLSLFSGCATVPSGPPPSLKCPILPALEEVPEDALAQSFTDRMASFLSGSLPMPTSYELRSAPAKPPIGLVVKP